MINLFNYLLISNIFTGSFILFNGHFDFYIGYVFMTLFLSLYIFSYGKVYINKSFIFILLVTFILSLLNVALGNDTIALLLKTTVAFIFNGVVYYLLIRINYNRVEKLFHIYLKIACVVAAIGIFQEISFLFGFKYGYDYSIFLPNIRCTGTQMGLLKVTSILQEPTHFGAVMVPAIFVSILNIIQKKKYFINKKLSCLIIISVLLSFSLVTYIGIAVAFVLIMLNHQRVLLISTVVITLFFFMFISYRNLPDIQMRVDQTVAVITGKSSVAEMNLSTFSFCSNGLVAFKSFMNNPLFGSGLGSHSLSYDKYILAIVDQDQECLGLNKGDGSSLFFRLISETGMLGTFLFIYFIFRFYISRKRDGDFWVISNAILCLFILNLLRQGNYFYSGFIFFVWAYYFANKNSSEKYIKGYSYDSDNAEV